MNPHVEILEHDIENFGLTKDGKAFRSSIFDQGWGVDYLIHIDGVLDVLVLKNQNGTDAVWYFEKKTFIGHKIKNLKIHRDKIDILFKLVFVGIINHCIQTKTGFEIIYRSIKKKGYFFSEFLFACEDLNYETITRSTTSEASVNTVLFQNGRDLQDECITSKSKEYHASITLYGEIYTSSHGIVISDFTLAYPFKSKREGFCLIIEGRHHSAWQILFMEKTLKFYHAKQPGGFSNLAGSVRALINHLIGFEGQISDYMRQQSQPRKCGIIRNAHIGHSLWNDISALQRVSDKKIINNLNEILVVGGEASEPWIGVEAIAEGYKGKVNRDLTHASVAEYVYKNNMFPIRLTDNYIKQASVDKIVANANSKCDQLVERAKNELRVVFGLRVENRTWINQENGLVQIARFLAQRFDNLTLIIDGHDLITTTGKIHSSYRESNDHNVLDIEKKLVFAIQDAMKGTGVRVVDAVAMSLDCSVAWINSSDFFIAPWGAGLAKYKWISNLPGVIFSNQWNMTRKNNLDIYQNPEIREGATSCVYVDESYVMMDGVDNTNLIHVPDNERDHSRDNFYIDPKGIEVAIEKVLTQIGRA